jgi:hypothetical protein
MVPNWALISSETGFGLWAQLHTPGSKAIDSKMMIELGMTARDFLFILLPSSTEFF